MIKEETDKEYWRIVNKRVVNSNKVILQKKISETNY